MEATNTLTDKPNSEANREKASAALNDFHSKLTLSLADREELWRKRGLSGRESEAAGFKTNDRANYQILSELATRYDTETLVKTGLWVPDAGGGAKPNSQFYGYGLIARRGGQDESALWGWKDEGKCNPIIIPYFNARGHLFYLRPHKGGISGKPPHLYVARSEGTCDTSCLMAVVTEGEFKARALHAVLNSNSTEKFAVAALPGITMAKHRVCLDELLTWLKGVTPKRLVIAYDSEEKGDRCLPAFTPNPRKRHEAQVWARYLANVLNHEGFDAAVAVLPKEWREPRTGKIDWDGRLAVRLAELASATPAQFQAKR